MRVEPADVEEAREFCGQQVENGVARVWIFAGGNESGRLVQRDVNGTIDLDALAIDFDVIVLTGLNAEIGDDLPVQRDATGGD